MSILSHRTVLDAFGNDHREVTFVCDGPDCVEQTTLDPLMPLFEHQPFYDWGSIEGCGLWSLPDDQLPVSANFHSDACLAQFVTRSGLGVSA